MANCSSQPKRQIVFDGDYVDRGNHSLEVFAIILLLKLAFPQHIYMLRGNHEDTFTGKCSAQSCCYGLRDNVSGFVLLAIGPCYGNVT